jgi:5-methylcytosine-specific restriction protein A
MPVKILPAHRSSILNSEEQDERQLRDRWRGSARERGYTTEWDHSRDIFISENPLCAECKKQGRLVQAKEVDHITPHRGDDELFWDQANWQSLCSTCHKQKTARENGGIGTSVKAVRPNTPVTVVCGPPAAGKTTYVMQRMKRGDLVIDLDRIFHALTGLPLYDNPKQLLPFVAECRDAILARLLRPHHLRHVWIITSSPKASVREQLTKQYGATVLMLVPSEADCIKRSNQDSQRIDKKSSENLIREWFQQFES